MATSTEWILNSRMSGLPARKSPTWQAATEITQTRHDSVKTKRNESNEKDSSRTTRATDHVIVLKWLAQKLDIATRTHTIG